MPTQLRADITARLRAAGCVFAEEEAELLIAESTSAGQLEAMIERRVDGEPLEQIVGWAEFAGLRIVVAPTVFVPRRRTELIVREALALLGDDGVVIDLCCGTGAVGAALLAALPGLDLTAADIDPVAVDCARRNLGERARVVRGDLYAPLPRELRGRIELIAVNAPYVPTAEIELMPPEARLHEARVALDGGADGLDLHRRIAAEAADWLLPGGHLLIETSVRQAPRTAAIFEGAGLGAKTIHSDDLDATVVIGVSL